MKATYERVEAFCQVGSGATPSRIQQERFFGGGIPWVKSGELREATITRTQETVTDAALRETALRVVPAGAILVAMYGATIGRIGRLGINATTNQAVCHVIPDPVRADGTYIFHALQAQAQQFVAQSVGGAQPNISQQIIRRTEIFLPPIEEQRRIAAILDQADALRAKRRMALAQLDELAEAILLEMFGDPSDNERQWPKAACIDVCLRIKVGVVVKPASYYQPTGVPAIRGTNVKIGGIDLDDLVYFSEFHNNGLLANSRLRAGDLVVVRTGKPGLCAIVPPHLDGANAIDVIIATVKSDIMNPIFLRELLNSGSGRNMILGCSRGQIQQHFNVASLAAAEMIVPPIQIQRGFAERIAVVQHLQTNARASLSTLNSLFASLQHRAFAGEL